MSAGECAGASPDYYAKGNAPIPADCYPDADAAFQNTGVLATEVGAACRFSSARRQRAFSELGVTLFTLHS